LEKISDAVDDVLMLCNISQQEGLVSLSMLENGHRFCVNEIGRRTAIDLEKECRISIRSSTKPSQRKNRKDGSGARKAILDDR
jgi:hypothetical protein